MKQYRAIPPYLDLHTRDLIIVRIFAFWGYPGLWGHHSSLCEHFQRLGHSQKSKNYTKIARNQYQNGSQYMFYVHFTGLTFYSSSIHWWFDLWECSQRLLWCPWRPQNAKIRMINRSYVCKKLIIWPLRMLTKAAMMSLKARAAAKRKNLND